MLRRVVLEVSLKPFGRSDGRDPAVVAQVMARQWAPLLRHAGAVDVLLWASDGSEILDYRGRLEDAFEWACWIGAANPREVIAHDPERQCLHSTPRPYHDHPPRFTYAMLRDVVGTLRRVLSERSGLPVRIGATFDPGGEFARSSFKYERHNEICLADTMGKGSFVCCYATLHADGTAYAAFPQGIAEGLPLGTFLGGQLQRFCRDLGFDYAWFSNGFGLGMETWKSTGPLFDGQRFDLSRAGEIRERNLEFWRLLRERCDLPIELRGTNLGTGADLATDAVPLRDLYRRDLNITTPPNSPWAAINGDFGIELVGYLSRIAQVAAPDGRFPFRFYTHDPWWLNSPWLDRYQRQPHDIYLPLSVARLDEAGAVRTADSAALLTIDDARGQMPEQVALEVTPHLVHALQWAPDAPGPVVWAYPFDEVHDDVLGPTPWPQRAYFNDWFVSDAVNRGLPLNTVIATAALPRALGHRPDLLRDSVLLMPVPDADAGLATLPLELTARGLHVLLYGPVMRAAPALLGALGLRVEAPLDGVFTLSSPWAVDDAPEGDGPLRLEHRAEVSGGGLEVARGAEAPESVVTEVWQGGAARAVSVTIAGKGGRGTLAWVRGSNTGGLSDAATAHGADLLRRALSCCGIDLTFTIAARGQRHPVTTIHRHCGAYVFSGYVPDTTVAWRCRMPLGAPLLTGAEVGLRGGRACYRFGRAWRHECRVFVAQAAEGVVGCNEYVVPHPGVSRRLKVTGLHDAAVVFAAEPGMPPVFRLNSPWPHVADAPQPAAPLDAHGRHYRLAGLTGELIISW